MADFTRIPSLDPRLQRLTVRDTPEGVADDARSGLFDTVQTPAGTLTITRVLVLLATRQVPAILQPLAPAQVADRIYSVSAPIDQLDAIARDPGVVYVEGGRRLLPSLTTSVAATGADKLWHAPTGLDGRGVVIGIIDYGLDFTLADFRDDAGKTRVAYLWDQSLIAAPGEQVPADFPYGVEYDRAAIDTALADEQQGKDVFARVRHRPDRASHGTHVAGIAAGNGRSADANFATERWVGCAPRATIVYVQPRAVGTWGSFTDSVHVADAIAYVYARARDLGMPCVINMSLGQNGGSHDAESVVERAIDMLAAEPGRVFVCAAGNEHIWRGHASGILAQDASKVLRVQVGGGLPLHGGTLPHGPDRTPNEIEIWYSSRDRLSVLVRSPDGEMFGPFAPGGSTLVSTVTGNRVLITSERFSRLNGDAQIFVELSPGTATEVRSGGWEIELQGTEIRGGRFDAYIERDVRDPANHFADQAFFVDFDAIQTLGTPATTRRGITVANYDHVAGAPNDTSSRGPTRDGRFKPDVAAPGTNIISSCALGGRQVGGHPVPIRTPMSGTSMAAPHVAGIVAQLLQRQPTLTAEQVAAILIATASPVAADGAFDNAWGYGRVDAVAALAAL